jgi:hypothetical protein
MADKPRSNEYEDKIYTDEKGNKYQGQRFIILPDSGDFPNIKSIEVWYLDGCPAIVYSDGLSEEWENGKFVKTINLPYHFSKD